MTPGATKAFVLVHGGWHGAWCWRDVAPRLRAAGHDVHVPTLTGLGERAHLLGALGARVDLELHVRDILEVLDAEDLHDVVLVGHSYAGMVLSGVVDRASERIAHPIFVDAFLPSDGQSLFDILPPERREFFRGQAQERGDGWLVPPPSAAALGITDPQLARWLQARLSSQPLRTFEQPVRLSHPAAGVATPATYVHCTAGAVASSFVPFARRVRQTRGWSYHELATGHDVMLTMPEQLAALLLAAGAG